MDNMASAERLLHSKLIYATCAWAETLTQPYSPKEQAIIDALAELNKC